MATNTDELKAFLALKSIKGVGNIGALKLLEQFGSASSIFNASTTQLRSASIKNSIIQQITQFDFTIVEQHLKWAKKDNCHLIPINTPLYPPLLAQIHSPPILLFVLGNPEVLLYPQIAVVGSRQPTAQGLSNTKSFCQSLCGHGLTITSGMAIGIDGEAHISSLKAKGFTIAVAGTGLNRVYPAHHRELAHQIAKTGALVSENFPDDNFNAGSFQQRNRIIAGLSLGTLVIEAAAQSGTLITAKCAMEEGREVYAVPGSIHNPLAKGCHYLIKQGAKLVETIEDILEDLPSINKGQPTLQTITEKAQLDQETANFLRFIDYDITSLDTIILRSELTVEAVTNKLLMLELQGWVINTAGGYIRQ
ncbi:DNA-processing protein DprA [Aliikangiella sp. IMCC44359]|uniref:DNA-processing protein DprA n=1 Tax=Aliikangiella sp. IMCC44359 TaxID=3459125 RepID=UPI00403A8B59